MVGKNLRKIPKEILATLPDLLNEFPEFLPPDARSRIINYTGVDGLKQVTANSLRAKGELLIFEIANMGAFLDFGFCEKVRRGFVANKIRVRELTNQATQKPWTRVEQFVRKSWDCRYVDPKVLKMNIEMVIYNDVVATYSYKDKKIFCVEVYNHRLAEMQKQIFNFMWHHAEPLVIKKGGATQLIHGSR